MCADFSQNPKIADRKAFRQLLEELKIKRERKPSWSSSSEYMEVLCSAAKNERMVKTIMDTAENYWKNYTKVLNIYGAKMIKLAEEVRRIKEYSIKHLDELIKLTCENIEANKGHCYVAKDAEEARNMIGEIAKGARTVVKAKSITSEEIYLREHLEDMGMDVFETDLGEFLVQVLGPKPMHLTSPALHIPREKVAEFLERLIGKKVDSNDIPGMVAMVRRFLRQKFVDAEVGITGANAIAADPGQVFIVENEGNARLASALPDKHIVIAGVEKIVPTYEDAAKVVDVLTKYSGYRTVSYISIIGGPSKTGDIEKKITYGAHGPKELHVVLLDNGRLKAAKDPILREALYCLRCGACMYVCPIFRNYAGYWGGDVYMGGIGTIWTAITEGLEKVYPLPLSCLFDLRCAEQCPMKINQPKMLFTLTLRMARGR
jgi:L-lactate dehydrogenase complex protein LldG